MKNENYELTPKKYIQITTFLFFGFLLGPIFLGTIAYYTSEEPLLLLSNAEDIFFFIVPIAAFSGILIGTFLFKKTLVSSLEKKTLREKLNLFQSASIIKYASIEGPAILSIVAFFNSNNLFYLLIAICLMAYFFLLLPTKDKIEQSLKLRGELKNQFNKENGVIK
ncbi:MAG: hypothetical protein V3U92_11830 [Cellulophaga sp.]